MEILYGILKRYSYCTSNVVDFSFIVGQTTKVGRLAMADDKGGSPAKVGRHL